MASFEETPTRKVIVKRGHGGGHHGGAWKVAYADFVTTMMALFIVLWITGQSESVKQAVARYFRHPGVFRTGDAGSLATGGAGILPGESGEQGGNVEVGPGGQRDAASEEAAFQAAAADIRRLLEESAGLQALREQVEIQVAPEGLRIELIEREGSPFFRVGSATVLPGREPLLQTLARVLRGLPNHITIEGHTDSRQYSRNLEYSNWELSTDRANSARRVMEQSGLPRGQVDRIVGYADRLLRVPEDALHASNRRITLIVRRQAPPVSAPEAATGPAPPWALDRREAPGSAPPARSGG
jgi:chemotaxis protein MotB